MEKTGKLVSIEYKREFKGSGFVLYYHDIVLDNGDRGSIGLTQMNSLKVGETLNYTIEQGKFGFNIKRVFNSDNSGTTNNYSQQSQSSAPQRQFGGDNKDVGMMVGNAITNACVLIAHGNWLPADGTPVSVDHVEAIAREICRISLSIKEDFSK
jgi:hypothetical protein